MAATTEQITAEKEAQDYWGYLFKPDKTGTEKLKKLLRALYRVISTKYDRYDSNDLLPSQLAHFYRELNGNYDPLFLSIPPATIQFIYKNLGCLHSLQPLPTAAADNRFADPTIPALKVEGWIMWETIQLLLGPDEHAGFLMNAVTKWDLKDPDTGKPFPKILPRGCFPVAPDAHMTAWYEGVSERLRREAEEEQSMRITAVDEEPRRQIEAGGRSHRKHDRESESASEREEPAPDSRKSALAYFKNPLFRNNEGRPQVVRRDSKHPTLIARGKSAANSVGHVVRNIGSPHLWDGSTTPKEKDHVHGHGHREGHRERDREHRNSYNERDREKRRKSLPHAHQHEDEGSSSPRVHPRQAALHPRKGSAANSPASDRDNWDVQGSGNGQGSSRNTPTERHHHRQTSADPTIRHSKSHDPTPSPKDYFPPYDTYRQRRSSAQNEAESPGGTSHPTSATMSPNSQSGRTPTSDVTSRVKDEDIIHSGFMPTASPLFATQVSRAQHSDRRSSVQPGGHQSAPPYNGHGQYIPRSSGRDADRPRYDSPARSPTGRSSSNRRVDAPGLRVDSGRATAMNKGSPPQPYGREGPSPSSGDRAGMYATRPKVARFDVPVGNGRGGRSYQKDAAEDGYRSGGR